MGVKSDRWIKEQSMLPLGMVRFMAPHPTITEPGWAESLRSSEAGVPTSKYVYGDPFTNLEEAIAKVLEKYKAIPGTEIFNLVSDSLIENFKPMIEPFLPMQVRDVPKNVLDGTENLGGFQDLFIEKTKIISKGLSSFGYDVTLAEEAAIFTNLNGTIIDPLNFDEKALTRIKAENGYFILPPNSYMLGHTKEYFRVPPDVIIVALGKSTYARAGLLVNVTPVEPGFEGQIVIELANSTSLPMKVYANQGISQFLFFQSDEACEVSYADRAGKYQGQRGLTLPRG